MTTSHLDEEALSAAVDGEATESEQVHFASCPACQERADTWRVVARAVASPVPPRPRAATDAAIRSALDVADQIQRDGPPDTVAAPKRARLRVLALAAAVTVVLGSGGLLAAIARNNAAGRRSVAASGAQVHRAQGRAPASQATGGGAASTAAGASAAAPASPQAGVAGRELGPQTDPAALARLIDGQIDAPAGLAPQPGAPAPEQATSAPMCVDQGAAALFPAGQHPSLRYVASLVWRGEDAVALVYDRPGGGRSGVVMARVGCRLLAALPV